MRPSFAGLARWPADVVRRGLLVAAVTVSVAGAARAQDYRVRIEASAQTISFRGVRLDSITSDLVVPGVNGGPETPEGHAVRCTAGTYCFFFRPGPALRGVPVTTSASLVMWRLGVQGLSIRAAGRLVADVGRDDVWPASDPFAQLLEGYLEYERSSLRTRLGRQLVLSRLEPLGIDGGWARARWDAASLELTGYGGWGLGQAAALPASSPTLNPLDDWRPRDRQIVAGGEVGWSYAATNVRAEYRREMDPRDGNFVSERAAMSFAGRIAPVQLSGGLDYNLAESHVGSADLTATFVDPRFSVSAGARRYRPYFSLWTLWGAFSPVPYNAVFASALVPATEWLSLRARGELYRFEDAGTSSALVTGLQDGGWRASAGATASFDQRWVIDGVFGAEFGPGASERFLGASADYTPGNRYSVGVQAGILERPLELRYYDAVSRWVGARAHWQVTEQQRLWANIALFDDDRNRPDASASSLAHVRVRAGASLTFGSGADRMPLPPARRSPR
jgi:hypothetical protein